jgi:hypothetical protein
MMAAVFFGAVMALAGYLAHHRGPAGLSRNELLRLRRLSDEARRAEIHPFE